MSMPSDRIVCTGCDFEGFATHRPIWLVYELEDGSQIELGRDFGWCDDCKNVRDIEPRMDARVIGARIEVLRRETESNKFNLWKVLNRLFAATDNPKKEELTTLEQRMRIARQRRSKPRCLTCGSESTHVLLFDDQQLSEGVGHECGGRLRREPADFNAPRLHFRPEKILLDAEGLRLERHGNEAQERPGFDRDHGSDVIAALVDQCIGCQSFLHRAFAELLGANDIKIRRIELTYLAAAVITYAFLRFGRQRTKEKTLDEFALKILERSIPSSRERISLSEATEEYPACCSRSLIETSPEILQSH